MNARIAGLAVSVVAVFALPASAHVSVNPSTATKGGFAKLAFRVPNERANAGTTKVVISFPASHPFTSVSVRPHPGWTYKVTRAKLPTPIAGGEGGTITEAVSQIEWTGGRIGPGEFDEFEVSVGRIPENVDSLTFPAVQTYSNGEVVRWIETRTPGGAEPEHPAPVLRLVAAEGASSSPSASAVPSVIASATPAAAPGEADDEDEAEWPAWVALGLGAVALLVSGTVALRGRSR